MTESRIHPLGAGFIGGIIGCDERRTRKEDGWERIGLLCSAGRRSLWIRFQGGDPMHPPTSIELCAGREGDDAYVKIEPSNPAWNELLDVLEYAIPAPNDTIGMLTVEDENDTSIRGALSNP